MPAYLGTGAISAQRVPWPKVIAGTYPQVAWSSPDDLADGAVASYSSKINVHTWTNATAGERPVRSSTAFDGKPGLTFSRASSQKLWGATALATALSNQAPFTIMYMVKALPYVADYLESVIGTGKVTAPDAFTPMFLGINQGGGSAVNAVTSDFFLRSGTASGQVHSGSVTQRGVVTVTYDGTTMVTRRSGVQSSSSAQGTIGAPDAMTMGAQRTGGGWANHANCILGDAVYIPGAVLSPSEILAGETWFQKKYAASRTIFVLGYGDSYEEGYHPIDTASYPTGYPRDNLWMIRNSLKVQGLYAPSGDGASTNGDSPGDFLAAYVAARNTDADVLHINAGWGGLQVSQMVPGTSANDRLISLIAASKTALPNYEFWGVCQVDGFNGITNYTANWLLIEAQIRALFPGSGQPWCMFRHKAGAMTNHDAAAMAATQAAQLSRFNAIGNGFAPVLYQMPEDLPLNADNIHPSTAGTVLISQGWATQTGLLP